MLGQLKVVKPFSEPVDGYLHQVGDGAAANLHPCRLLLQPGAVAVGAEGLAPVAAHHDAVLYLIHILLHHVEEGVNAYGVGAQLAVLALVCGQSMPKQVLLLLRQLEIGLEDGKVDGGCTAAELLLPHLHLIAMPALHAALVDRQRGVGDDEALVDADDAAEALAGGAGAGRRVEREHVVVGFLKHHAVGLVA